MDYCQVKGNSSRASQFPIRYMGTGTQDVCSYTIGRVRLCVYIDLATCCIGLGSVLLAAANAKEPPPQVMVWPVSGQPVVAF